MNDKRKTKAELIEELSELRSRHKATVEKLEVKTTELTERLKELNCLFQISQIKEDNNMSFEQVLMDIVDKIPEAFSDPGKTCARIIYGDKFFATRNFRITPWFIDSRYLDPSTPVKIEVFSLEPGPEKDLGPFLTEEQLLVNALAGHVSKLLTKLITEKQLENARKFNETIISNAQEGIFVCGPDLKYKVWNKYMEEMTGMKAAEVLGREGVDMFPHMLENKIEPLLRQALNGQIVHTSDIPYEIPANNISGWYSASYSPMYSYSGKITGIIGTIRDTTKYVNTQRKLKKSREKLRAFAGHLQSVRENERISIAREIHDEFGQVLTALKINLSLIEAEVKSGPKTVSSERMLAESTDMKKIIDRTIDKTRKLVSKLRPEVLDNLGLIEALEWYAQEFSRQYNIECQFDCRLSEFEPDKSAAVAIFRIYQESLTNVARHARATRVYSQLKRNDDEIYLEITDNGIGISQENLKGSKSFGLLGIKERANVFNGEVKIGPVPDGGTSIILTIPCL